MGDGVTRRMAGTLRTIIVLLLSAVTAGSTAGRPQAPPAFDHGYRAYAALLRAHVRGARVDYRALAAGRPALDAVAAGFDAAAADVERWSRNEQIAFWINAYNVFTLRAIVDHYPIRGRWFSLAPRNSIRQIDGVWTTLTWRAAGRTVTLDDIEHRILRPVFRDPRVHFALNCASVSCPPLAAEPYRAATLDADLDAAARRHLAGPLGLVVDSRTLRVSSIFKWYGEDFVERFADAGPAVGSPVDRAILGVVRTYGPAAAAALAASGRARVRFLDYDWSLNDVARDGRR